MVGITRSKVIYFCNVLYPFWLKLSCCSQQNKLLQTLELPPEAPLSQVARMASCLWRVSLILTWARLALAPKPSWPETHAQSAWLWANLGVEITAIAHDEDFMTLVGLTSRVCRATILSAFIHVSAGPPMPSSAAVGERLGLDDRYGRGPRPEVYAIAADVWARSPERGPPTSSPTAITCYGRSFSGRAARTIR